jgi:hypothetical protein
MTAVGETLKGVGDTIGGGEIFELFRDGVVTADAFVFEDGGFDGIEAAETPAGGGHGFDEFALNRVGGLEAGEEGIEKNFEFVGGFGGEDDGVGGESVTEAVGGGARAAGGGAGAMGFGSVDAGGGGASGRLGRSGAIHDVVSVREGSGGTAEKRGDGGGNGGKEGKRDARSLATSQ